jgi:hypothetical protein
MCNFRVVDCDLTPKIPQNQFYLFFYFGGYFEKKKIKINFFGQE